MVKNPILTLLHLYHTSNILKDFLKTVCYMTNVHHLGSQKASSSMSSNMIQSSSSDSIHSVQGKSRLVKQWAQEIKM